MVLMVYLYRVIAISLNVYNTSMNIGKKYISKKISKEIQMNINDSDDFLNSFIEIIKKESINKNIKIKNFGTFYNKKTAKRVGRNPKTMNSYIIKPFTKLQLQVSKKVRGILNWN